MISIPHEVRRYDLRPWQLPFMAQQERGRAMELTPRMLLAEPLEPDAEDSYDAMPLTELIAVFADRVNAARAATVDPDDEEDDDEFWGDTLDDDDEDDEDDDFEDEDDYTFGDESVNNNAEQTFNDLYA